MLFALTTQNERKEIMKKLIALLLVLVMAVSLAACDSAPTGNPTETQGETQGETQAETQGETQPEAKSYVWDVTVVFDGYDAKDGEFLPTITMTEKANSENTCSFNYYTALGEAGGIVESLLNEDDDVALTGELKASTAAFNEADWDVSDADYGSTYTYEVVTPLTEGDYDTHGQLVVTAKAKDYVWNVTVVFGEGMEGTYEFNNPGLPDWGEPYVNQKNTVTPDDTTFEIYAFNHSPWIVDNIATWYQWGVTPESDVQLKLEVTVMKYVTKGDRQTPGQVTITILPNA